MYWEKYKPKHLDDFKYNSEVIGCLKHLVQNVKQTENLINMGFYGCKSSGKLTLCRCFLASIYGDEIFNFKELIYHSKHNCTNYSIKIIYTKYHFEISFCGLQFADKYVLIDIINKFFNTLDINNLSYKILVIKDFESLSLPAQLALRRKIEINVNYVRFIFLINELNKVDNALLSRICNIRCKKPNTIEHKSILDNVIKLEKINIKDSKINTIISFSDNNIGKSFIYLYQYTKNNNCEFVKPEQKLLYKLKQCLLETKYPLHKIRDIISNILLSRIKQSLVFKEIMEYVIYNKNIQFNCDKIDIISKTSHYEHLSQKTNKFSICLEALLSYIYYMKVV